jgi:hypothetical protein
VTHGRPPRVTAAKSRARDAQSLTFGRYGLVDIRTNVLVQVYDHSPAANQIPADVRGACNTPTAVRTDQWRIDAREVYACGDATD